MAPGFPRRKLPTTTTLRTSYLHNVVNNRRTSRAQRDIESLLQQPSTNRPTSAASAPARQKPSSPEKSPASTQPKPTPSGSRWNLSEDLPLPPSPSPPTPKGPPTRPMPFPPASGAPGPPMTGDPFGYSLPYHPVNELAQQTTNYLLSDFPDSGDYIQPGIHQPQHHPQQTQHHRQHHPQQTQHHPQQPQHQTQQAQHHPQQPQHHTPRAQHHPQQTQHHPQQTQHHRQHHPQQTQHHPQQPQHHPQQARSSHDPHHISPIYSDAPPTGRTPAQYLPPRQISSRESNQHPPPPSQKLAASQQTPATQVQAKPLPSWEELTTDAEATLANQKDAGKTRGTSSRGRGVRGGGAPRARASKRTGVPSGVTPASGPAASATATPVGAASATATPVGTSPPPTNLPAPSSAVPRYAGSPDFSLKTAAPPASRRPLEDDVVKEYDNESLDELRRIARQFSRYYRLTAEQKVELDGIYDRYQRDVHKMAIKHQLDPAVSLSYLGNKTRIRGPTNYNNFCVYDPQASPIHHDYSKTSDERAKLTAALWNQLDKEAKAKFRDPAFLETLPNPYINIWKAAEACVGGDGTNPDEEASERSKARKQYANMKPERWAQKTMLDLKRIAEAYQVEGFMVFVCRHRKQTAITAGGSYLGQQYLDITEDNKDVIGPAQDFADFVNGSKVIKKHTGLDPLPVKNPRKQKFGRKVLADGKYDKGSKELNLVDVREKLRKALSAATGGRYNKGWPGKTKAKLQELGVKMEVQKNDLNVTPESFCGSLAPKWDIDLQHLQVAIGEGWFRLNSSKKNGENVELGSTNEGDEDDETSGNGVSTNSNITGGAANRKKAVGLAKIKTVPRRSYKSSNKKHTPGKPTSSRKSKSASKLNPKHRKPSKNTEPVSAKKTTKATDARGIKRGRDDHSTGRKAKRSRTATTIVEDDDEEEEEEETSEEEDDEEYSEEEEEENEENEEEDDEDDDDDDSDDRE
ncbi:hypothetical protein PGTUg99_018820 [Puccinia graminis f. sp. tritici]|uniref:Uncharacterized protein n=1 Tax=Puccinia graminis f. sp. tritici TaxID=56615 RepID=A0A5B0QQV6_PUCGR|nr:hypothetical protein PGTUg99_018820 [Puccinia graminis f. sp. tritici]